MPNLRSSGSPRTRGQVRPNAAAAVAAAAAAGRRVIVTVGSDQRISDLHQLEIESSIALAIMALICRLARLGGRRTGAGAAADDDRGHARQISEANLHERLAMQGPPDELRQLADTIDGLLGRLEGAFDAQRRFVANASHELRTPLTAARALLEMVLSDPTATVDDVPRRPAEQVLEESEQQEQLIDALLALAHGQRGIDGASRSTWRRSPARCRARREESAAVAAACALDVVLSPAPIAGDRRLIERLVSNLVDNAIRHNVRRRDACDVSVHRADGQVDARGRQHRARWCPPSEVERLLQPFQRWPATGSATATDSASDCRSSPRSPTRTTPALEVRPGADREGSRSRCGSRARPNPNPAQSNGRKRGVSGGGAGGRCARSRSRSRESTRRR